MPLFKGLFLLIFTAFFAGCSLSAISSRSWLGSPPSLGGSSNAGATNITPTNTAPTNTAPTNSPTNTAPNVKPSSYFVEIWVKGESVTGYFWQPSAGVYANGVTFQIMHLDKTFVEFEGVWWKDSNCHQLYGFTTMYGNFFDIKRYIVSPDLKTPENSSQLHLYYWIVKKAFLFGRNDLYITVPVEQFNPDIHQNIARFTLTVYPDVDDTRPDALVFDGFVPK